MPTPFVGRKAELEAVDRLLERLDGGHGGALAVRGEAGIGKTRLLAEVIERAESRGQLTLHGTASELDRDVPFWVFVDALEDYVRGLPAGDVEPLGEDALAELAQILPSLRGVTNPTGTPTHERYRSHQAVRLLLEQLAGQRPLVLVLDDLHWADSGSLELLLSLLRRMPSAPVLIVVTLRPHLLPDRVANGLERAARSETLTWLDLEPLPLEDARALLEHRDESSVSLLYTESGGNPFYLEQLARSVGRETGSATRVDGRPLAGIGVPPAIAASLAEELGDLGDDTRVLLQAAAVAGDPFEPDLAAAAAQTSETNALDAIDELLARDLIRATDVPRRFRFRHPLVGRAVYESASPGWRLVAHERCAEALAAKRAPVAARARHVELSARPGDAGAVAVLRAAGEDAAGRAPATAARWFEGALRLASEDSPAEERVELLLAQARSLSATGRFAESHAALTESISILPPDAAALRLRLITKCAVVEHQLGRYADAQARLESALAASHGERSPEAVGVMLEVAVNALFRADFERMDAWSARALVAAEPLDDPVLTATALTIQAAGAAMSGRTAHARERRDEGAALLDQLSDEQLGGDLDALTHLSLAEMYLDRFEDSRRHAERAMRVCRATGQGDYLVLITATLGASLWIRGRPVEAVQVLEGAVEAARLIDDAHGLCWTLFNLSDAAAALGAVEVALAAGEESWQLGQRFETGPIRAHAGCSYAMALMETGHAAQAVDLFMRAGDPDMRIFGGARNRYLEALTRCFLMTGSREDAARTASVARSCADAFGLPLARGMAQLASAAVELDGKNARGATEAAVDAVAAFESVEHAHGAARAKLVAGRAFALGGDSERAAEVLQQAAFDFGSFGAARHRAEAERELRKLGRTVYRRSAAATGDEGIAALTARELELAELVVDRKTNREIAAELFLSQNTVETHLRNIFRKLDVSSRVELARAVERAQQ